MIVDTSIIDRFIREKSDENIKNHWIFDRIAERKRLYQEPQVEEIEKYTEVREILLLTILICGMNYMGNI